MPDAWSAKRERQLEHVTQSVLDQGRSTMSKDELARALEDRE